MLCAAVPLSMSAQVAEWQGNAPPHVSMSPAAGEVQSVSHPGVPEAEYECFVVKCPTVEVMLGDVKVMCLLDTGSNVSNHRVIF